MKFFFTDFNANRNLISDGIRNLLEHIPKYSQHTLVSDVQESDAILLTHTCKIGYKFVEQSIGDKPIVILDYAEPCWDCQEPYFLGFKLVPAVVNQYPSYIELHNWVASRSKQVKAYFKKAMFFNSPSLPVPVYPVEWTGNGNYYFNTPIPNTFDEFIERTCDISFIWGLSNPSRPILHGEMMKRYPDDLLYVHEAMLEHGPKKNKIVLFWVPEYLRMSFERMMDIYRDTKISISLWGCGQKCYRDIEACFNSVVAIQEPTQTWSHPWIDGKNCIILPNRKRGNLHFIDEDESIRRINHYLEQPYKLYEIYLEGMKQCAKYRADYYLTEHLLPKIEAALT